MADSSKFLSIVLFSILLSGFNTDKSVPSARVELEIKTNEREEGRIAVLFKAIAKEGYKLTLEAPWRLSLRVHGGGSIKISGKDQKQDVKTSAEYIATQKDLDQDLPGFKASITNAGKGSKVDYTLEAFSCTQDKTRCFKDKLVGTYALAASE